MNPFIVHWLFDVQKRLLDDEQFRNLLEDYKIYSQQMSLLLPGLSDEDWHAVNGYMGTCFALYLRLLELALMKTNETNTSF